MKAFEMEMVFTASVGFREINSILQQMGMDGALQAKDAMEITVTQILPRIPEEEYLKSVARILKDNYMTDKINITECHFSGYKSIREIEVEE